MVAVRRGRGGRDPLGCGDRGSQSRGRSPLSPTPKYLSKLDQTRASAVVVSPEVQAKGKPLLCVKNPYLAFAKIVALFSQNPYKPRGIDPLASICPTARFRPGPDRFPFVHIGERCIIGDRVTLYPGVSVGDDSSIGEDTILHPNVSIYPGTILGKRVILHSGVVVGSDGFGYAKEGKRNLKIPKSAALKSKTMSRSAPTRPSTGAPSEYDHPPGESRSTTSSRSLTMWSSAKIPSSVAQVGGFPARPGSEAMSPWPDRSVWQVISKSETMSWWVPNRSGPRSVPRSGLLGSPTISHRDWLRMVMTLPRVPEMRKKLMEIEKTVNENRGSDPAGKEGEVDDRHQRNFKDPASRLSFPSG